MTVRVITGAVNDGRFRRGERRSPETEFKKGQHWRAPKPHWQKEWLVREYVELKQSAAEIAKNADCTPKNILFWLEKHGIPRRSISQARTEKHWGLSGEANPMYGKTGALNPRYVDGSAPERQTQYARAENKAFLRRVYDRDGYLCRRCFAPKTKPKSLHVHHIKPWAGNPDLRFSDANAITLCRSCHSWVHSKANVTQEYLA